MPLLTDNFFDEIKNDFDSDTIVLMGNGKSLTSEKLNIILESNLPVFAVNRFFLSFKDGLRLPDFYAISDHSQFGAGLPSDLSKIKYKYTPARFAHLVHDDWYFVNHISRSSSDYIREFSKNASEKTYGGYTVIFFALQILYQTHFNKILLIGCDNNYDLSFYEKAKADTPNGKGVLYTSDSSNHFIDNYFNKNELITAVYPEEQNMSFKISEEAYQSTNKRLINISDISTIPIQKDNFYNWFTKS